MIFFFLKWGIIFNNFLYNESLKLLSKIIFKLSPKFKREKTSFLFDLSTFLTCSLTYSLTFLYLLNNYFYSFIYFFFVFFNLSSSTILQSAQINISFSFSLSFLRFFGFWLLFLVRGGTFSYYKEKERWERLIEKNCHLTSKKIKRERWERSIEKNFV